MIGDFNARKGSLSDSTENGLLNDFQLTADSDQTDIHLGNEKFGKLHSLDLNINKYGRSLINICSSNRLSILNGRTWEDIPATNPMGQVLLIMLLLAMVL